MSNMFNFRPERLEACAEEVSHPLPCERSYSSFWQSALSSLHIAVQSYSLATYFFIGFIYSHLSGNGGDLVMFRCCSLLLHCLW